MRVRPSPFFVASLVISAVACGFSCGGTVTRVDAPSAEARVTSLGAVGTTDFATSGPSELQAAVPIATADPSWGSRRALVTVVVFGDLECPYTGRIAPTISSLEAKYGPDQLRIVWKDDPLSFHPHARAASEAAESVYAAGGSGAFWKFWSLALRHQTELSPAAFEGWAVEAGVTLESYKRAMDAHAGQSTVDADHALTEKLHVTGTPTSAVNGTLLVGAQPLEKFITVVDAELVKAKARLAAGVDPDALYTDLTNANWHPPKDEPAPDDEADDTRTVWQVPVGNAPGRGPTDALVTIVEFSDFQCPYCKRVEATLKRVRDAYGDKVRIVWKDEPLSFHPHALPAASLAREARAEKGDSGFWAAHDAIFDAAPALEDSDLARVGAKLGLDAARVKSALEGHVHAAHIAVDLDLAEDVHAEGTPHFFINGRRLAGAQPFEAFKAIIDEEVKHTEGLVAQGTPKRGLYDALMKTAKVSLPGEPRAVAPRAAAPFKGPADATVVIEEFADFQCPFCMRVDATLDEVLAKYGSRVKLVWRSFPLPFHAHAQEAAEAAAEAQAQKGNVGFWAMHDKLFAHQQDHDHDGSGLARAALDTYAREIGLDVAAFDRALDSHTHRAEVLEDSAAADAAGVNGAPAFFVGGYFVSGAQPFRTFERLIEVVLASGPAKAIAAPGGPSK